MMNWFIKTSYRGGCAVTSRGICVRPPWEVSDCDAIVTASPINNEFVPASMESRTTDARPTAKGAVASP